MGLKSRKALYEALVALRIPGIVVPEGGHTKMSNEVYGKKAMIYVYCSSVGQRVEAEKALEAQGFKTQPDYDIGHPTMAVQVSWFKGYHWDE